MLNENVFFFFFKKGMESLTLGEQLLQQRRLIFDMDQHYQKQIDYLSKQLRKAQENSQNPVQTSKHESSSSLPPLEKSHP